jgi:hypothetical protein
MIMAMYPRAPSIIDLIRTRREFIQYRNNRFIDQLVFFLLRRARVQRGTTHTTPQQAFTVGLDYIDD